MNEILSTQKPRIYPNLIVKTKPWLSKQFRKENKLTGILYGYVLITNEDMVQIYHRNLNRQYGSVYTVTVEEVYDNYLFIGPAGTKVSPYRPTMTMAFIDNCLSNRHLENFYPNRMDVQQALPYMNRSLHPYIDER